MSPFVRSAEKNGFLVVILGDIRSARVVAKSLNLWAGLYQLLRNLGLDALFKKCEHLIQGLSGWRSLLIDEVLGEHGVSCFRVAIGIPR